MDIHLKKLQLVQGIIKLQDEEAINELIKLVKKILSKNIEEDFRPMSIDELYERINNSEADFRDGNYTDIDTLISKYKWAVIR